tara:strand:- start:286 stop:1212 length:927 start_codon:yes stop_codon:yes gene_type:complete
VKSTCNFLFVFIFSFSYSLNNDYIVSSFDNHQIHGTLLQSDESNSVLTIIIPGSGPTDRDGNNISVKSDYLKMLAEGLHENGVSTFRYDKRGVGKSIGDIKSENEIKFSYFVNDVISIINHFKESERFKKIVVIGHSEGSLIGMIASRSIADNFISIAGSGEDYLTLIQRQLSNRAPWIISMSNSIIKQLRNDNVVDSVPPVMNSLFNLNAQKYLIDASRYDPIVEISKLNIPVLIIQGTNDIQVEVNDAQMLHDAAIKSRLEIIKGMNHVFRQANENYLLNLQTYANPDLPLDDTLLNLILDFIDKS